MQAKSASALCFSGNKKTRYTQGEWRTYAMDVGELGEPSGPVVVAEDGPLIRFVDV